jgi:serine/threonine protein kinase
MIAYGGYPMIVDFGFAKIVETKTYTLCGTPLYLPPEVILNRGHDIAADHWSLGILIFEMVAGRTPFFIPGIDRITLYRFIVKGSFLFPENTFSREAMDLIEKFLTSEPQKRLGSLAGGLDDIFQDPWFSSIDFAALRRKEIEAPWIPPIRDPLDKSSFPSRDHIRPKKKEDYPKLRSGSHEIFKDFGPMMVTPDW